MNEECSICFEKMNKSNSTKLENCNHKFHIDCVHNWLKIKSFCPLCRFPVISKFKSVQKFGKNLFLECEIELQNNNKLKIKYSKNYYAEIDFDKIQMIYTDNYCTKIIYKNINKLDILFFRIPKYKIFLESFKNLV